MAFSPPSAPVSNLDYFAMLVADDASFALTEAAASLGQDDTPTLDTQAVLGEVDTLADRLKRRIPADAAPIQKLRLLNRYFFDELGFAGNVNDYYDPHNSYLHCVLRTRRGIPISLGVLYIELASHIGLTARGVSFPGHFLIKLKMQSGSQQGEVVIDPFTGQSLSRADLDERLAPYRRRSKLLSDDEMPLSVFLQAATPRDVLARMLRNLKEIHRAAGDWQRLLAVQQRLVILLPQDWLERRDRGLAQAELGQYEAAVADISDYLDHTPGARDRVAMAGRVEALRAQRRPRLH